MEIITGIERHRRWRLEDELQIVSETEQPGACFAEIARRYEVSRGLLWNWRSKARGGLTRATLGRHREDRDQVIGLNHFRAFCRSASAIECRIGRTECVLVTQVAVRPAEGRLVAICGCLRKPPAGVSKSSRKRYYRYPPPPTTTGGP